VFFGTIVGIGSTLLIRIIPLIDENIIAYFGQTDESYRLKLTTVIGSN
jgi:hypothetical protein